MVFGGEGRAFLLPRQQLLRRRILAHGFGYFMGCTIRVRVRFAALRHNKAVIHLAPHDEFLEPALLNTTPMLFAFSAFHADWTTSGPKFGPRGRDRAYSSNSRWAKGVRPSSQTLRVNAAALHAPRQPIGDSPGDNREPFNDAPVPMHIRTANRLGFAYYCLPNPFTPSLFTRYRMPPLTVGTGMASVAT